jgi:hypothetical protein
MLFILLVARPGIVSAENSRYRVEILVLTHLEHSEEAQEVKALDDFSAALDFLTPPPVNPEETDTGGVPGEHPETVKDAIAGLEEDSSMSGETAAVQNEMDPWSVVTHVEEMGPQMQEAWRRLRLSGPFRPLQFLAWDQGNAAPFPVLRIHDLDAVMVDDPWAEQRLGEQLAAAAGAASYGSAAPVGSQAPVAGGDSGGHGETLPDPIVYYRLDGTASLTRSRFLRLSLAVEWREPVFGGNPLAGANRALATSSDLAPPAPTPSSFLVHRLEQSRSVRSGRMEYFDGPVLSVLAWISDISDTVPAEQPE